MTLRRLRRRVGACLHPAASLTPGAAVPPAQRGMVTVETAIAIPALLLVALFAAGVPAAVSAQVACGDAAREAALMLARDVPRDEVVAVVERLAPDGASLDVTRRRSSVAVRVRARVFPVTGLVGRGFGVPVAGRSVAARENVLTW